MKDLLSKIEQNTAAKDSFQIIVSSNQTRFNTRFNPPIQLDKEKKYEMALVNLETYYSFPNIDSTNNLFKYSPDNGSNWFDIIIPEGSYDVIDLNNTIQQKMRQNNHFDDVNDSYFLTISANPNTLRSILAIEDGYLVDFRPNNSLRSVLGFKKQVYKGSYTESEQVVNILSVNSILVNIDLINGSYVNESVQPTVYSFFPNVPPGYKIIENPVNLVYLPLITDTIYNLETSLTDQNGKQLNLRGENLTIRFHIKQV